MSKESTRKPDYTVILSILLESLLTEEGKRLFADKILNSDERWRKHHTYQTSSVIAQQTASTMLTDVKGKKIDRYSGTRKQFIVEIHQEILDYDELMNTDKLSDAIKINTLRDSVTGDAKLFSVWSDMLRSIGITNEALKASGVAITSGTTTTLITRDIKRDS